MSIQPARSHTNSLTLQTPFQDVIFGNSKPTAAKDTQRGLLELLHREFLHRA